MINVRELKQDCLDIARDIAPKDTGNLAFNAIVAIESANGFEIVYRTFVAPYVEQLETGKNSRHKGFISKSTTLAVSAHINSFYNGGRTNLDATKERLAKLAPDNPARQQLLLASISQTVRGE